VMIRKSETTRLEIVSIVRLLFRRMFLKTSFANFISVSPYCLRRRARADLLKSVYALTRERVQIKRPISNNGERRSLVTICDRGGECRQNCRNRKKLNPSYVSRMPWLEIDSKAEKFSDCNYKCPICVCLVVSQLSGTSS